MALPAFSHLSNAASLKPYLLSNARTDAFFVDSPCSPPRRSRVSISLAFSRCLRHPPRPPLSARCSIGHRECPSQHEHLSQSRPREIPWNKDLANSVHLIGFVAAPVEIKHLSNGKFLGWTRLSIKMSAAESTWIGLVFWNDLAHVAFRHVEKGQQVYVSGKLVSDVIGGEDEKRQVYYKVIVKELKFVQRTFPKVSLYEPETHSVASVAQK